MSSQPVCLYTSQGHVTCDRDEDERREHFGLVNFLFNSALYANPGPAPPPPPSPPSGSMAKKRSGNWYQNVRWGKDGYNIPKVCSYSGSGLSKCPLYEPSSRVYRLVDMPRLPAGQCDKQHGYLKPSDGAYAVNGRAVNAKWECQNCNDPGGTAWCYGFPSANQSHAAWTQAAGCAGY